MFKLASILAITMSVFVWVPLSFFNKRKEKTGSLVICISSIFLAVLAALNLFITRGFIEGNAFLYVGLIYLSIVFLTLYMALLAYGNYKKTKR